MQGGDKRLNTTRKTCEFKAKICLKKLTSSWSYISGSCPVYGLHHAAQMLHSPRQPHQPGPRTQKKHLLKPVIMSNTKQSNTLPGDQLIGISVTLRLNYHVKPMHSIVIISFYTVTNISLTLNVKLSKHLGLFKYCPQVEEVWVSYGLRRKQM